MSFAGLPNIPIANWSVYKDPLDANKIKARNNRTGEIAYNHATNFDPVLASIINGISPAGTPTSIEIEAGDFPIAATFAAIVAGRIGNIKIKGQGIGITNLILQTSITGTARGIDIAGTVNAGKVLTVNAVRPTTSVTVSTVDAATFAVGNYVLLKSNKVWTPDLGTSAALQGEIRRITAINGGSGVVTLDTKIWDTYNTVDSASINKIDMLQNIYLEDFTVKTAPGYTATGEEMRFYMIDNLRLNNVEMRDNIGNFSSGIVLESIINFDLSRIVLTQSPAQTYNLQYGIWCGCASAHGRIDVQARGRFRHSVTTGGIGGFFFAGVPRDLTISGTSEATEISHFDTHGDGENITFQDCGCIGHGLNSAGGPDGSQGLFIQCRTRRSSIVGCRTMRNSIAGIHLSENANDCIISSNLFDTMYKRDDNALGNVINLTPNIIGTVISNNTFLNCNGVQSINTEGNNHDTIISNNVFRNCTPIKFTNSNNCIFIGNRISNGAFAALTMAGTSTGWTISSNNAAGSATSTLVGSNTLSGNINIGTAGAQEAGDILVSDGTHLWLSNPGNALSIRKFGGFNFTQSFTTVNGGYGMLAVLTAASNPGSNTASLDTVNGRKYTYVTGAAIDNRGGFRNGAAMLRGDNDPKMRFRFKFPTATDHGNSRMFYGFMGNTEPTGETPLDAGLVGVLFGFRASDANFQFYRNDTTGAAVYTNTGVAKDTALHEVKIVASALGTKWSVSFDGGAYTDFTTDIPSPSNVITPTFIHQTTDAVAKSIEIYSMFMQTEK